MCDAHEWPREAANEYDSGDGVEWLALSAALGAAAQMIERDPDAAALLLDGLLERMLGAWYLAHGWRVPARGALLADLDQRAPELARRIRLALRAPDIAARLAHCRQVSRVLAASWAPEGVVANERNLAASPRGGHMRRIWYVGAVDGKRWPAKGGMEHVG